MGILLIMLMGWGIMAYVITRYFPPSGSKKDTGYEVEDMDELVYKAHKPRLNGKKLIK